MYKLMEVGVKISKGFNIVRGANGGGEAEHTTSSHSSRADVREEQVVFWAYSITQ